MSTITEIKEAVTALSPVERHELMCWLEAEQADYGDIPEEALIQNAAALFQMLDREEAAQGENAQGSTR